MIGLGFVFRTVTLGQGLGDFLAYGAFPSARILPCEAVLFARSADDALGILVDHRSVVLLRGVFVLRLDEAAADFDRVEFVGTDAAVEDLVAPGGGVEGPLAVLFDDGNGQGESILADR